jgi:hypothetical protein
VTIGPSFSTQRQEASEIYMGMAQNNPQIMGVAGDLVFKSLDLPLSDEISERLKTMLPPPIQQMLSQGKRIPPEAQAIMVQASQAMQQVQQMGQQLQAQQAELENEKAVVEGDKAKLQAEVSRLQAEEKVIAAKYGEAMAKIENAMLKNQADAAEKGDALDTRELQAKIEEVSAALQAQAAQFMTQAAGVIAEMQNKATYQVMPMEPKRKVFRAERDQAGNLIGGIVEDVA